MNGVSFYFLVIYIFILEIYFIVLINYLEYEVLEF